MHRHSHARKTAVTPPTVTPLLSLALAGLWLLLAMMIHGPVRGIRSGLLRS